MGGRQGKDILAQAFLIKHTVKKDSAGSNRLILVNKLQKGGLAAAGFAHHTQHLALGHLQVDLIHCHH